MIPLDWKRAVTAIFLGALGAVFLAACGTPQVPPAAASSGQPREVAVDVVLATVSAINVTTTYAAIVEPVDQVDVVSLATGRVDELTVDIGSDVKAGQVIAELSHGTLDVQLQEAQAMLDGAQATLASVQAAAGPNQLIAQARLDAARAGLIQLLNPSASDIKVAQSAVTVAQSNLDSAKAGVNLLLNPSPSELQERRSGVSTAQANLDSTKIWLDQLLNPSNSDVAAAQETVADARAELSTAQAKLNEAIAKDPSWQILLGPRIRLQANKATLDNPAINRGLTPEEISDAEQAIVANQEQISILLTQFRSSSLVPDDIWNSNSLIPEAIRTALWYESKALTTLETASAELLELQTPGEKVAALAQHNVAIARDSLDSARAILDELENPAGSSVAQAEYDVEAARATLEADLARLNLLKHPKPADLTAAKVTVAIAEQTLALNQEAFTRHNIQAEHARVAQAMAQVNLIQRRLEELKILAPFDGFVTKRWLAAGAIATPQTPIVTVFSKDVVVSLRIEETGVNFLHKGQQAQFTTPGLPTGPLDLRIAGIAPASEQAAHTFSVQLSPVGEVPNLKPGMSGEVSISIRHDNVVVAPRVALLRRDGRSAVFVVRDGVARLQIIDLGLADGQNMEIMAGVKPGDRIVVAGQHLLQDGVSVTVN